MDHEPKNQTTNLTPDSTFLRDLAARLPSEEDRQHLLGFADRWDELYRLLEAAARARWSPNLHNPSMG